MTLAANLRLTIRFVMNFRQFDAVWQRKVLPLLATIPLDHPLRGRLIRRMKQHTREIAGFFGPAVFDLFGVPLNSIHRSNLATIGACIPLFDMCFDDGLIDSNTLTLLVHDPFSFSPSNGVEQLAATLYKTLLTNVPQPVLLSSLTNEMLDIEAESRLQLLDDTAPDTILIITKKKGGTGGLFFTAALPRLLNGSEREALYQLGSWVQLIDDLFDLRDDALNGIRTPVTDSSSAASIKALVNDWQQSAFSAVQRLDVPAAQKRRFLCGFVLYGAMAHRYIRQIEKQIGNRPLRAFADVSATNAVPHHIWKVLFD